MALINCKQCGRLFNRVAKDICPDCIKKETDEFSKVSEYLRKNRGASPVEVHEATEVELEIIYRFIREGRLVSTPNMTYPCDRCGNPTTMGRFCKKCTDELQSQFGRAAEQASSSVEEKQKPSSGGGFHIKDRFGR